MGQQIKVGVLIVQWRWISTEFGFHGLKRLFGITGIYYCISPQTGCGSVSGQRQEIRAVRAANRGHGVRYIFKPGTRTLGLKATQQDQEVAGQVVIWHRGDAAAAR